MTIKKGIQSTNFRISPSTLRNILTVSYVLCTYMRCVVLRLCLPVLNTKKHVFSGVLYGGQRPQPVGGADRWRFDAVRYGGNPRDRHLLADAVCAQPEGSPHRGDRRHQVREREGWMMRGNGGRGHMRVFIMQEPASLPARVYVL